MAATLTQRWPQEVQVIFKIFCVSFLISIMFTWLEVYEVHSAEHSSKMASVKDFILKCMQETQEVACGERLKGCIRFMCRHRDDLCREYFEAVYIDPIVLVPPTKVFSSTLVRFLTLPLIFLLQVVHCLKDLPVVLQTPACVALDLVLLVFVFFSAKAVISAALLLWRPRRPV